MDKVVACETCGLVQEVDRVRQGFIAKCARCNFRLIHRRIDSRSRTLAFTLAAAVLYFPSNLYPLVTAEYQGQFVQTTVFQGIRALWHDGQYFISALVFCTSMFTPALKILGLFFITLTLDWKSFQKTRGWIYRIIRIIDPWNMLEVFLLAIGVAVIEMGEIATIHPGRGVFSFAAVVVLTLMATLTFDPRLLWDSAEGKNYEQNRNAAKSKN
jgi:paraquat-inducible protein A